MVQFRTLRVETHVVVAPAVNLAYKENAYGKINISDFHGDDVDQFALDTYKSAMPTIDGTALFRGETVHPHWCQFFRKGSVNCFLVKYN